MLSEFPRLPIAFYSARVCSELKLLSSSFGSDGDTNSDYYATIRSLDTLRDVHMRAVGGGHRHKNSSDPPVQFTRVRNSSLQLDGAAADEMRAFSPNQLSRARRKQLSLRGLASEGESTAVRLLLASTPIDRAVRRSARRMSTCFAFESLRKLQPAE